ncbi:MAG TPA: hypothetical protein VMM77_11940 [Gemmatimonadaceae bacterium]|nr:hypothetical protein [Gemmatimonadaceae bacterium]
MHKVTYVFLLAVFALGPAVATVLAQASLAPPAVMPVIVTAPRAAAADVESIDAIISALYDVISGGVGQARNWNRMRSLFVPGGKLMPTIRRPDGTIGMRILGVNDYIAGSGPQLERVGFREREIARRVEQFGHIAHVFSTYKGRTETDSMVIRGINSIQLMNDGTRWWVVSVFWEAERPNNPLPPRYLQNEQ